MRGVARTVTHRPAHSDTCTTPVQFATRKNTGTVMIDGVPGGGSDSTTGAGSVPSNRPYASAVNAGRDDGTNHRNGANHDTPGHSYRCHTTGTPAGGRTGG